MTDSDGGDRLLNLVGVAILGLLVLAGAGFALAIADGPNTDTGVPNANWTMERLNGTHVQITHDGGDPVRSEGLLVTSTNEQREFDAPETITEGDSFVVRADEGRLVELRWTDVGGRPVTIASERL